jgi:glycosyltransferase involved in cell wall biosynthesis
MVIQSISVLIPNYNWDVTKLIAQLHDQLQNGSIEFEILCFENGSDAAKIATNEAVNALPHTHYEVKAVEGRAQNRNALARAAKYNFILFIDGDADISHNPSFISDYRKHAKAHTVICGGTAYDIKTDTLQTRLRYKYGKAREELSPSQRQKNAHAGFSAFNFYMPKDTFLNICFDEKLSKYGHEDTLFGRELKFRCIPILHIQNTAVHLGLDTCDVFLSKTRQAVENLSDLINEGLIDEDIKLYAWYLRIKKSGMTHVLSGMYSRFHATWAKQLCGQCPSLKLYDLYKLSYLCSLPVRNKKLPVHKI